MPVCRLFQAEGMNTMSGRSRREQIVEVLEQADRPVSASTLAKQFHVSRQIIVGDIALLRASGVKISATPKGYLMDRDHGGLRRQIVCQHTEEQMGEELCICVDHGCAVLDVIVEHPVYGQLAGQLRVRTRYDVNQFLELVARDSARGLAELTNGIHLHTLRCPDEAAFQRVRRELDRKGFLVKSETD